MDWEFWELTGVFFLVLLLERRRYQQVTEEQNCEEQVFPLAVNLLDRFLALEAAVLQRCQLQLLGCVCLLTASKLRQCRPIGVDLLVYYTDYSVTAAQIRVSTRNCLCDFLVFYLLGIYWPAPNKHKTEFIRWRTCVGRPDKTRTLYFLATQAKCPTFFTLSMNEAEKAKESR